LPKQVEQYLDTPDGWAARKGYKCRNREPWYCVPDVRVPDAFLSVMSTNGPRLVGNSARCVCSNSIHAVSLMNGVGVGALLSAWRHPLTQLSCEVEGHHLGGGMLKVEPIEARTVAFPTDDTLISPADAAILKQGIREMRAWRAASAS
jgi:hypothetical protein